MTDENALWEDMRRLNSLYEELCWAHDDELTFTHDGKQIIIYNKTLEDKKQNTDQNLLHMLEGSFFMPRNQVSIEELRCRILKLKNSAYFDQVPLYEGSSETRHLYPGEQQLVQRQLNYVLDMLDEYRF